MRIRRRFITYANTHGITYHKLAVVDGNQTPPRRNYLTMLVTAVDKSNYKRPSVFVTFAGGNANLNIATIWVEGKYEGYTELECECNH